jgi:tRNA(fMet)-specific endonuclease VapC
MPGEIALDTNVVIAYFKGEVQVKEKLLALSKVYLPVPVAGELLFAAENSARRQENLALYREFIRACQVLNITRRTAAFYARIRATLKQRGRPIPENDLWIASLCVEKGLPLASRDDHFREVPELFWERW